MHGNIEATKLSANSVLTLGGESIFVLRSTSGISGSCGSITGGTNMVQIDTKTLPAGAKLVVTYGLSIGPFQRHDETAFSSATGIPSGGWSAAEGYLAVVGQAGAS